MLDDRLAGMSVVRPSIWMGQRGTCCVDKLRGQLHRRRRTKLWRHTRNRCYETETVGNTRQDIAAAARRRAILCPLAEA